MIKIFQFSFDKYILLIGKIHQAICTITFCKWISIIWSKYVSLYLTNTFCLLDKYIWQFGQINFAHWTYTIYNFDQSTSYLILMALPTNTLPTKPRHLIKISRVFIWQLHFAYRTNTLSNLFKYILHVEIYSLIKIFQFSFDKYILLIEKNTLSNLDKYILKFGTSFEPWLSIGLALSYQPTLLLKGLIFMNFDRYI